MVKALLFFAFCFPFLAMAACPTATPCPTGEICSPCCPGEDACTCYQREGYDSMNAANPSLADHYRTRCSGAKDCRAAYKNCMSINKSAGIKACHEQLQTCLGSATPNEF